MSLAFKGGLTEKSIVILFFLKKFFRGWDSPNYSDIYLGVGKFTLLFS